ncbi:MAG: alpha/beta fold hydrolase [Chloroflexi bacterium]|nr:alpha/beta fold hydrolase [Chloroflexota bacterium]
MTDENANNTKMGRREFLVSSGLGFLAGGAVTAAAVGFDLVPIGGNSRQASGADDKPWYELGLFSDPIMDERTLYKLGQIWYRMGDVGEILETASRIEDGSPISWRTEWYRTADRVKVKADDSLARGHRISAGEAYLRASSYYLAGLIYGEGPDDFDLLRASQASAQTFENALELLGMPGEAIQIPYEDTALPGYFFRSELGNDDAPILIAHQGLDASVEEALFLATEATRRGYHALLFHHPGQGRALRELGLPFRPDWENVITPVVDFALAQAGVDPNGIILTGLSFGGSLVTRAVAFEKRVRICIPNPAHYSWYDFILGEVLDAVPQAVGMAENSPGAFNTTVNAYLRAAPAHHSYWFKAAMWKFGADSPAQLLENLKGYTNADIVDQVTCKVLVMAGEAEEYGADHGMQLYEALNTEKDLLMFTAEDTALLHNQNGALSVSSHYMYDWLDENI